MPCSSTRWKVGPFSTDYVAWRATEGWPFAKDSDLHLPIANFHFRLVATKGAHVWWHVTPRGLGRYLTVKTGGQCIWIARPKASAESGNVLCPSDYDIIGNTGLFCSDIYDNSKAKNTYWLVEQIYLSAGMTMYVCIALLVVSSRANLSVNYAGTSNREHPLQSIIPRIPSVLGAIFTAPE